MISMKLMGTSKLCALAKIHGSGSTGAANAFIAELAEAKFKSKADFLEYYPLAKMRGAHVELQLDETYEVDLIVNFGAGMILIDSAVYKKSAHSRRSKSARAA